MKARVNDKLIEPEGEQMVQYYFDGKEWHQKWEKRFEACELVMTQQAKELENICQQVIDGKLSPLAYHLQSNLFNIKLLSSYTGIPKWRIKRHLKPKKFNQLNDEMLKKYADVFEMSVEDFKKY